MDPVVEFINYLCENMEGTYWHIAGTADFEEVNEEGMVYARVEGYGEYEKQDGVYIKQTTGYLGDEHHGTVVIPITDSIAVVVQYECD